MLNYFIKASALATALLVTMMGSATSAAAMPFSFPRLINQAAEQDVPDSGRARSRQLAYGYRGSRLSWRVYPRPSRYRVGGFSRSSQCFAGNQSVTALTPPPRSEESINSENAAVNGTLSSHPIFWLSVPQTQPTQAFFSLQKADAGEEAELHSQEITLSGQAGVIGIKLPESAPGLKEGETYLWQVLIQCEPESYNGALHLGSWIKRLDPNELPMQVGLSGPALVKRLAHTAAEEKALIYANLGIWQDTISTLAELRYRDPQNVQVQEDWAALLNATQMQSFVQSPILKIF